eukprot:Clim_evm66s88 gene=Clim_evmTU66s88
MADSDPENHHNREISSFGPVRKTFRLLEYEKTVLRELQDDNGLYVFAKGLSLYRIVTAVLLQYCTESSLVLVINANSQDEITLTRLLKRNFSVPIDMEPRFITSEQGVGNRDQVYAAGGLLYVTSRILVVDLLHGRVPVSLLDGVIVMNAHTVTDTSVEAFILRLIKQRVPEAWIKAFSDRPESFVHGFAHTQKVLKALQVRRLQIWPRFRAEVKEALGRQKVSLEELMVPLTPKMEQIQNGLRECIHMLVQELRRLHPSLDFDDFLSQNALSQDFDRFIKSQLRPIWHQVSRRTKQIVNDLNTIRKLLDYLTSYDCVTFLTFLEMLRASNHTFSTHSQWMFLDPADKVFGAARARVYEREEIREGIEIRHGPMSPTLEPNPKWKAMKDEVDRCVRWNETIEDPGNILIFVNDERTERQVRQVLVNGPGPILNSLYRDWRQWMVDLKHMGRNVLKPSKLSMNDTADPSSALKAARAKQRERSAKRARKRQKVAQAMDESSGPIAARKAWQRTVDADAGDIGIEDTNFVGVDLPESVPLPSAGSDKFGFISDEQIFIHPINGAAGRTSMDAILEDTHPRWIIIYDADIALTRHIEVHLASHPGFRTRISFMAYSNSIEEQRYLSTIQRENTAFGALIHERSIMVLPEYKDKLEDQVDDPFLNTRKGGGRIMAPKEEPFVYVDMREFRSSLPAMLHAKGITVKPLTMEIGDYVVTDEICIERKSLSDLVGSLRSGRLYSQCQAMSRHYKHPTLLIEFDESKTFALHMNGEFPSDISWNNMSSKLSLLNIHFPRLKMIWSENPHVTAEIIVYLKKNFPQPNDTAARLSDLSNEAQYLLSGTGNIGPIEFLKKMPGINSKNWVHVVRRFKTIAEIAHASREELVAVLGVDGGTLYEFIHFHAKLALI